MYAPIWRRAAAEVVMLAERMGGVKPSVTLAVSAKAKAMVKDNIDVVDFSVGEPDFSTPEAIKQAAIDALAENFTHYTPNPGIPELREAVCAKLKKDNGLDYVPEEILVTCGAKQAIYNAAMALFGPGDRVLVPSPCWVSYEPQIALAGAQAVLVEAGPESGFKVTPEQLEAAVGKQGAKAIIFNSPSNPTGALYSREEMEGLAEVLAKAGVFVISDEIYEKLIYDGASFTSFAALDKAWKERCLVINGVSKAYAMTGWRIGYAAGPAEVIKAMAKLQGHSTSNANSIAQKAALAALEGDQEPIETMRRAFEERRNMMYDLMQEIPDLVCTKPRGAFYLFPDWSAYVGRSANGRPMSSGVDLATYLLEQGHVAVVPGEGFGTKRPYLRFSYASSIERIRAGMARVARAAARLT